MQPQMGGIIQVNIPDRATLQASYMGYVQGGGLICAIEAKGEDGARNFYFSYVTRTITKNPFNW